MSLEAALGRRNRIRFAWIGFQRIAQRAGDRFKGRLRNMVAVDAMQFIDMQGHAAVGREGLKKFIFFQLFSILFYFLQLLILGE